MVRYLAEGANAFADTCGPSELEVPRTSAMEHQHLAAAARTVARAHSTIHHVFAIAADLGVTIPEEVRVKAVFIGGAKLTFETREQIHPDLRPMKAEWPDGAATCVSVILPGHDVVNFLT